MEIKTTKILINGLPKISLNEWYAGTHWSKRQKMKNIYKLIVKAQCKEFFSKKNQYVVSFHFGFKNNPLDASNTGAMSKLLEDILFENDEYNIVRSVTLTSNKHTEDTVLIIVETINNITTLEKKIK